MSAIVRALVSDYSRVKCRNKIDGNLLESIDLERAILDLYNAGKLSDMERAILGVASMGHSINSGSKELGVSRWLYSRLLRGCCRKIAKVLGWEYSDRRMKQIVEGMLNRELDEEEQVELRELLRVYGPTKITGGVFNV